MGEGGRLGFRDGGGMVRGVGEGEFRLRLPVNNKFGYGRGMGEEVLRAGEIERGGERERFGFGFLGVEEGEGKCGGVGEIIIVVVISDRLR